MIEKNKENFRRRTMKNIIHIFLILMLLLTLTVPVFAQQESGPALLDDLKDWKRSGQAAMPFLAFGSGGRAMAMGDAVTAQVKDASALFYNPAGIAYVEGNSVVLGNMNWLLDTQILSGAVAVNVNQIGTFGLSFMYYDYGDPINATEIDASAEFGYRDLGTMEPSEYVVGLGYGRQISSQFAIGGQVKLAHQDLLGGGGVTTRIAYETGTGWVQEEHDAAKSVIAFDVGTMYNTGFRDLTIAMSFRNFGGEVKYEREAFDLPITVRIGLSGSVFKLLDMKREGQDLTLNVDYLHPRNWDEQINTGLEYSFNNMFYVRGGYKYNYSSEGLSVGGGVKLDLSMGGVRIDYAYKDTKDTLFDAVHVYSLAVDF